MLSGAITVNATVGEAGRADVDVFQVHRRLIEDCATFTSGSIVVPDERIRDCVDKSADAGVQWPDPLLSLNPSFAVGGAVQELAGDGKLWHGECARIFRTRKESGSLD